jgi:apolipoprotein N-acyltransferase
MPTLPAVILLVLQALIAFLAFPNPLLFKPNLVSALLLPLAVAPFCVFVLLYQGRKVFLWAGLSIVALVLLPSSYILQINAAPVVCILIWLLLQAMVFLLGGAFGVLGAFIYRRIPWSFTLLMPALLCSEEFGRLVLSEYFSLIPPPSLMLVLPLAGLPPLIQMSSYTGLFGPAFLVFFASALLAQATLILLRKTGPQFSPPSELSPSLTALQQGLAAGVTGALAAILVVLVVIGNLDASQVQRLQDPAQRTLKPALLQSQFDPTRVIWGHPQQEFALRLYRQMGLEAVAQGAQVLVFNENALPINLPVDRRPWQNLREVIREIGLPAFVGLVTEVDEKHIYNVSYLLSPAGQVQDYYLKRYMTPFGEYLPLRREVDLVVGVVNQLLNKSYQVFKITAISNDYYDLRPGRQEKVFTVGGARVGLKVCIETIIPRFYREAVNLGAEVFLCPRTVNWFNSPADWYLNVEACSFRAVETRRWIGLVANMGAAAAIDALGIVRSETPYGKQVAAVPTLPLLTGKTFYVQFGDWFAGLCLLATVLLALAAFGRSRA